ncbi:mannan-binding lectin serine protease 1-like, partial [Saccoglossus kowalevskii]
ILIRLYEQNGGDKGSIVSPMYPFPYPKDLTFTTIIYTTQSQEIVLRLEFHEFFLRYGDYVNISYSDTNQWEVYYWYDEPSYTFGYSNTTYITLHSDGKGDDKYGRYSIEYQAILTCSVDGISNGCHVPDREKHLYGESLMVICDQGYYISTNYTNSTCQEDGSWEPDIPECV